MSFVTFDKERKTKKTTWEMHKSHLASRQQRFFFFRRALPFRQRTEDTKKKNSWSVGPNKNGCSLPKVNKLKRISQRVPVSVWEEQNGKKFPSRRFGNANNEIIKICWQSKSKKRDNHTSRLKLLFIKIPNNLLLEVVFFNFTYILDTNEQVCRWKLSTQNFSWSFKHAILIERFAQTESKQISE